jgi:hypothetical protein
MKSGNAFLEKAARYAMKFIKCLVLITFFMIGVINLWSQEIEVRELEENVTKLEFKLEEYYTNQNKLNEQANELATKISTLKEKQTLNYFQRRRLEGYLKKSQELSGQIEQLGEYINSAKRELSEKRKQLIALYGKKIDDIVKKLKNEKLGEKEKINVMNELNLVKQKRESLQAQIDLGIRYPLNMTEIKLDENDSPRQIKEKADLLKDLEKSLRVDADKLQAIISNLQEEIEIREKMVELAQDVSLFSHRDEPLREDISMVNDESKFFGAEDLRSNAFLKGADFSRSSILPLFPELIIEKDISQLSNKDIQAFINGLKQRKKQMLHSADSLSIRADDFYQQAEQAKIIKRQD